MPLIYRALCLVFYGRQCTTIHSIIPVQFITLRTEQKWARYW